MPSVIIAPIQITRVEGNATVLFGNAIQIAPKSAAKSNTGSGGSNTGIAVTVNNFASSVKTIR